jgi:Family of unknown function (DUF5335)
MQTIEIPRADWAAWLSGFTASHRDWLVSVDVLNPEFGAQPQVSNLPLLGVSAERVNYDDTVAVTVGRSPREHLSHLVHRVTSIAVERTEKGAEAALQIVSADGTTTLLRFRSPALPETVDGMPSPKAT